MGGARDIMHEIGHQILGAEVIGEAEARLRGEQ
jgi:hypothetical protein